MKARSFVLAALTIGVATLSGAAGSSTALEWVLLGQRSVNDRTDHDVIVVTKPQGDFRSIKITVQRAAVDFHRVVVHYGNGTKQEVDLRNTIPAGGETRAIDLTGTERVINRVEFWYDANTIRGRRATVRLYGLK